jgi:predicted dehydrogenase
MKKREFLKTSAVLASAALLPASIWAKSNDRKLRTAHIGVGGMGLDDMKSITSHKQVEVVALCDVDSKALANASKMFPNAKTFADYRVMLSQMPDMIDAVIVSTPDHTHAPASIMAMEAGKAVYCQKPLSHHVSESRTMRKMAEEKNLVTQMGIQVHSFDEYRATVLLIQSGIIGKVSTVRAWSPKNWGYDGPAPTGSDPVPSTLDWNLWLGTAEERPYKNGFYHPGNWRKLVDFGCGTLGDMGVHIFDTPYTALDLDVPETIHNVCRPPNNVGFPLNNVVTYQFPGTQYTTEKLKWVWYDGPGAPAKHDDLKLPNGEALPEQGAMFVGEKGRLLLPHFMMKPRLIMDGKYAEFDYPKLQKVDHYHQFVDACLANTECSAPFSYSARLTEAILLGVIAGRFPNQTLHWDNATARFKEEEANQYLDSPYRKF